MKVLGVAPQFIEPASLGFQRATGRKLTEELGQLRVVGTTASSAEVDEETRAGLRRLSQLFKQPSDDSQKNEGEESHESDESLNEKDSSEQKAIALLEAKSVDLASDRLHPLALYQFVAKGLDSSQSKGQLLDLYL